MSAQEVAHSVPDLNSRLSYREHQVQRSPYYERGPLDTCTIDEVRTLLEDALDYTSVCCPLSYPLPPTGLPGLLHEDYDRSEPAADLIEIGMRYVAATVRNERKAMHYRWRDAREFIRKIEERTEERIYLEQARRAMAESEARDETPYFVYFIGSESGPIKIGMAVRPIERLKTLQTSHHERLKILAICEGGSKKERDYHKQFKARRLNGERFERCPEIEAEIERLQK